MVDPVVGCVCGRVPFAGPLAIGHECVAEVLAMGDEVRDLRVGERVVVPWAVSCSRARGLRTAIRALAPGGVCTAVGYDLAAGTRLPLRRMYATDGTLRIGVSHARAILPELLSFLSETRFRGRAGHHADRRVGGGADGVRGTDHEGRPRPRSG
ncbi:MAG TPA: alcohol dehydrogenase catalytic domain-containing protein [Solirubrobacteraceae bacterium]|nr:alcohol dehydrogenase catalytic domain-containing protein [Solirubrobacteraceae bacterium]